jgi:hypothetical protein
MRRLKCLDASRLSTETKLIFTLRSFIKFNYRGIIMKLWLPSLFLR